MKKLLKYTHLAMLIKDIKRRRTQLVLVGGCFDILHLGHVRFLKSAKKHGTLIVALESDASLTSHKGHLRPIHTQEERAEVLASLETVDYVLCLPHFTHDEDYFDLVKTISPQVIAVTEGDQLLTVKQQQAESVGGKVIVIPKINTPSTTQLAKLLELE